MISSTLGSACSRARTRWPSLPETPVKITVGTPLPLPHDQRRSTRGVQPVRRDAPISGIYRDSSLARGRSIGTSPARSGCGPRPRAWPSPTSTRSTRISFEELARVAELHVADATGLPTVDGGPQRHGAAGHPRRVGRRRARGLPPACSSDWPAGWPAVRVIRPADDGCRPDPAAAFLGNISQVMSPVLIGMQAGFMAGHLARRALGQYDLPIPRPIGDELLVVPGHHRSLRRGLEPARSTTCGYGSASTRSPTTSSSAGRTCASGSRRCSATTPAASAPTPHRSRRGWPNSTRPIPSRCSRCSVIPRRCSARCRPTRSAPSCSRSSALVAAIEGYVDHVMDGVGRKLIASYPALTEALRRRRVERGDGDKFVERLLRPRSWSGPVRPRAGLRRRHSRAGRRRRPQPPMAFGQRTTDAGRDRRSRSLARPHRPSQLANQRRAALAGQ